MLPVPLGVYMGCTYALYSYASSCEQNQEPISYKHCLQAQASNPSISCHSSRLDASIVIVKPRLLRFGESMPGSTQQTRQQASPH